jgi:replication-associated recombination protein RarA
MNNLKLWRPRKFADIVGAVNQPSVHRLQAAAKQRRLLKGILLGPYGTVKTSIARLLLKSCLCKNPDPVTADPCHLCDHCKNANADHNGEWFNYQYWEVDCTQKAVNREFISGIISQASSGLFPPLLIFDELQRMHERSAQESLLKFTEDLEDGVILAVVMTETNGNADRPIRVLPALFERLSKFYFAVPEVEEFVEFFHHRMPRWEIEGSRADIREMVFRSERSFRTCFDVLEEARQNNGGRLDRKLIDQLLPKKKQPLDEWINPFANDED